MYACLLHLDSTNGTGILYCIKETSFNSEARLIVLNSGTGLLQVINFSLLFYKLHSGYMGWVSSLYMSPEEDKAATAPLEDRYSAEICPQWRLSAQSHSEDGLLIITQSWSSLIHLNPESELRGYNMRTAWAHGGDLLFGWRNMQLWTPELLQS